MKATKILLTLVLWMAFSTQAHSEIIPDYFDINGNPMHSGDEFDVNVDVLIQQVTQGYQYDYTVTSLSTSIQDVGHFAVVIRSDAIIPNSSSTPPYIKMKREPQPTDNLSVMSWVISANPTNPNLLVPGGRISGLSFISPYPPGIIQAYSEGLTEYPRFNDAYPDGHPMYWGRTPYGPGKIFPVIGPVKPEGTAPGAIASNVNVQQCHERECMVQLDATGPMDPYGTTYSYRWSGSFGTASGATPVVELPVGTSEVGLSVSDPYATLVTATIEVNVVNPNSSGDDDHDGEGHEGDHDGKKQKKHEKEDRYHH